MPQPRRQSHKYNGGNTAPEIILEVNEIMKKNKMMRLASVLLVAVLLSTCAISGTFAKYVSSDTATDNARVAYWGWGSNIMGDLDLFDGNYTNVDSRDDANVVAPGTEKTATISLAYTPNGETKAPEVAYKYDVVATATTTNGYAALDSNANFKWTLKAPGATNATEYSTVAELIAAINATSQASITANTLPTGYTEDGTASYTIGWTWGFGTGVQTEDEADTAMGNDTTPDDVTITITITVTQID